MLCLSLLPPRLLLVNEVLEDAKRVVGEQLSELLQLLHAELLLHPDLAAHLLGRVRVGMGKTGRCT